MDRESRIKEQLRSKYEQAKKRVKDWELAVSKTEGRQPTKDDMKSAPVRVQEAYREVVKIRKYLDGHLSMSIKKNDTAFTPGKIFLGSRRPQLQRSDTSYLTPAKTASKTKVTSPRQANPSLGLRSSTAISRNQGSSSSSGSGAKQSSRSFQPFSKLFAKASEACPQSSLSINTSLPGRNKKKHDTILVKDDSNVVTERKVLIAERLFKSSGTFSEKDASETVASSTQAAKIAPSSTLPEDSGEKTDGLVSNPTVNVTTAPSKGDTDREKACKVSKALKLRSPQIKSKSFRTSRTLNSEWLDRITDADTEAVEANQSADDDSLAESCEDHANTKVLDSSGCESFTSEGNEQMGMVVDSDSNVLATENDVITSSVVHGSENSDSGICVNSFFTFKDVCEAMDEVLNETPSNNDSIAVISDAGGSLLYNFSEDACLPSDPEQEEFSTVDENAISNIIQSLSDSNNDAEDEASKSTRCSSTDYSNEQDTPRGGKRPASFAFSPSPQKPEKKRKFFTSRKEGDRKKVVFSLNSYKPPSPIKKTQAKNSEVKKKLVSASSPVLAVAPTTLRNTTRLSGESQKTAKSEKSVRSKKKINHDESMEAEATPIIVNQAQPKGQVVDIFDEAPQMKFMARKKGRRFQKNVSLDSKLSSGKVDDNYVRIDTKRKVFVRGHKKTSVVKMKRLEWKQKKFGHGKKEAVPNSFTCNKCGEKGHFAKFCTKGTIAEAPEEVPEEQQDDSPFPTLEEAARMVYKNPSNKKVNFYTSKTMSETIPSEGDNTSSSDTDTTQMSSSSLEHSQASMSTCPQLIESVDPFFSLEETPTEFGENEDQVMQQALKEFGYENFRPGQQEAMNRVLKGLSTLLILSTGSGKSLCYQLPAYLYQKKYPGALTLCISPLVSLMEDQVQGIPLFLNAACLHSNMTTKQKAVVLEKVQSKKLHILLVSPEAVCGGLFGLLRGTNLPRISFACIDEIHCVSQWSHNFRPSYLQLCKILREKLNVKTILGLTATATKDTVTSICEHLSIDPSTAIRGELIPRNLKLSVSRDVYKDEALMNLLRGERLNDCDSIIIYCTRREECERIATLVRTKLQETTTHNKIIKTKGGARLSGNCEAYHAGMTARKRKNVQDGFMSGGIRIVVATVAFGMGIDKSDIRAVIHYNMPKAFESYVQEIGRAGRDGLPAHCHLFLDNARRNDLSELRRHVYANSVDRPTVRKLLRKVFQPCKCGRIEKLKGNSEDSNSSENNNPCPGHEVSFSIDSTVLDLDLPKENITTLLCYLELDKRKWIEILPLTYDLCKIQSYGGAQLIKSAAARCPPLAVAIALQQEKNKFRSTDTYLEFNVIEAAATVGWNSGIVKKELKNLEWSATQFDDKGNPTKFRKSGLLVEFSNLAWRVKSSGLTDDEADQVLNSLHGRNVRQEQTELDQLNRVYQALMSVSFPNVTNLCDSFDEEKSNQLKKFIYDYFHESSEDVRERLETSNAAELQLEDGKSEELRRSVRQLVDSNRDVNFTTRSIAKIFQGISSPCFPADVWYRNRDFWRRYLDVDFHLICRIAAEEL